MLLEVPGNCYLHQLWPKEEGGRDTMLIVDSIIIILTVISIIVTTIGIVESRRK